MCGLHHQLQSKLVEYMLNTNDLLRGGLQLKQIVLSR